MLTRAQKKEIVQNLIEKLSRQTASVFADLSGLSIPQQQELRSRLRSANVEMVVARKTLLDLALRGVGIENALGEITKPFAVVVGYGDVVAPAKIAATFHKEFERFAILGGLLGSRAATMEELQMLAQLPGRDELLAKAVGSLAAPLRGLMGVLQGAPRAFLSVLQQRANASA